jgi:hypothetical protein
MAACALTQTAGEKDLLDFGSEVIGMAEQQCLQDGLVAMTPCVFLQGPWHWSALNPSLWLTTVALQCRLLHILRPHWDNLKGSPYGCSHAGCSECANPHRVRRFADRPTLRCC